MWSYRYPCFELLVTSALGFKARVDHMLACFITSAQWIPQIHLWCDPTDLLMVTMTAEPFLSTYKLVYTRIGTQAWDRVCGTVEVFVNNTNLTFLSFLYKISIEVP